MQKFPLTQTMVVLTHVVSLNMSYIRGKDMADINFKKNITMSLFWSFEKSKTNWILQRKTNTLSTTMIKRIF